MGSISAHEEWAVSMDNWTKVMTDFLPVPAALQHCSPYAWTEKNNLWITDYFIIICQLHFKY